VPGAVIDFVNYVAGSVDACRLADAQQRIKVLESLLKDTYLAHPKLVDWAIRNKSAFQGADMVQASPLGSEQLKAEKQVQGVCMQPDCNVTHSELLVVLRCVTHSQNIVLQLSVQKVAKLKQQRDQWRDRACQLKDMCKDLQKQLQSAQPGHVTAADHVLVRLMLAGFRLRRCWPQ
jgi:DNA polymerase III psi subunit